MGFAAENGIGNIVDRRFYPKVFEGIRFGLCRNTSRIKDTRHKATIIFILKGKCLQIKNDLSCSVNVLI